MLAFNKIVEILSKKWWKVLLKNDIFEIIDPECKKQNTQRCNKLIYRLKSEGSIISLKAGVYIVPEPCDVSLNSIDLIEKYFLKLLKRYIVKEVWSHYYISGQKSLEFHLKDLGIPEKIFIVNRQLSKRIQVGKYEIIFKTVSGKDEGKKINLYSKFSSYVKQVCIEWIELKISALEMALLESALISESYEWPNTLLLIKAIKKYNTVFDYDLFRELGKYKYNMSYNRLKELSKPLSRDLYDLFLEVIKKNGWCFVGEGLRGI